MKILHTVQMYYPDLGGSEEVVKQLSERLAKRGHDVTVATNLNPARNFKELNGVRIEQFEVAGNASTGIYGDADRYVQFLARDKFDVMMNYAAQIWSSDLAFHLLDRLKCGKVFVPCGYSGLMWPQFAEYFANLHHVLRLYDAQIHLSEDYRDARYARLYELDNSVVIPNAAAEEEFSTPSAGFRDAYGVQTPLLALCVANHYSEKGHAALIKAFQSIGRDDVTLAIIGNAVAGGCLEQCRASANESGGRIIVAADVPRALVVAAYHEADLFALTSQVECFPLVILEAMASGTPWLSTDVGNVTDLPGGVVAAPQEFAAQLGRLFDAAGERAALGSAGRSAWLEHYTWERIVDQYEALYERVSRRKGK
ncbi:MAG: glycosyltransferase family 4 protein [Coriobacteriia bacterium]|nr:glycosyltransferase family 4 protein [Coriobacteriia bacterium]